jgi:hypothetical protein
VRTCSSRRPARAWSIAVFVPRLADGVRKPSKPCSRRCAKEISAVCGWRRDRRRQKTSGSLSAPEKPAGWRDRPGIQNSFGEDAESQGRNENVVFQNRRERHRSCARLRAVAISVVSEHPAERILKDQSARSASRLPLYFLIFPAFRSRLIRRSASFTKRFSSCSVTPYSRRA